MLGSVHDAEDALQDALLRAWRGAARASRAAARCALAVHDRHQHLPERDRAAAQARAADRLRPARPTRTTARRAARRVGLDRALPRRDARPRGRLAAPDARYEQRESVELAFVAALQHLPANQRAVLILREVLGFSAAEVAESLETTRRVGQQRAAARAQDRRRASCPSRASRRRCARSATSGCASSSTRYVDAWERGDVDAVVAHAHRGRHVRDAAARELVRRHRRGARLPALGRLGAWRWLHGHARERASRPPGVYAWDDDAQAYLPFALNVLMLEGDRIKERARS